MPAPRKYPHELRERAIRLVLDIEEETGNTTAACRRIGQELGSNSDTLRGWVKRAQIDSGKPPGTTSGDATRIRQLERENAELLPSSQHTDKAPSDPHATVNGRTEHAIMLPPASTNLLSAQNA